MIEKVNGQLIGSAKKQSVTAKKLSNQITEISQFDYVKIQLYEEQLNAIYIKRRDKALSTVLPILGGAAVVVGLLFLIVFGI